MATSSELRVVASRVKRYARCIYEYYRQGDEPVNDEPLAFGGDSRVRAIVHALVPEVEDDDAGTS